LTADCGRGRQVAAIVRRYNVRGVKEMATTDRLRETSTILLLSSEPVVRAVMKEILVHAGYVVEATGDLGTAVERLAVVDVSLLITHPYVEGIPGYEAAKYLRQKNRKMAVLVVAGLVDDDRFKIPADLERFVIFPKPFTAAELIEEVELVLKLSEKRSLAS
jgi:CheY-like chemotaxis protein